MPLVLFAVEIGVDSSAELLEYLARYGVFDLCAGRVKVTAATDLFKNELYVDSSV